MKSVTCFMQSFCSLVVLDGKFGVLTICSMLGFLNWTFGIFRFVIVIHFYVCFILKESSSSEDDSSSSDG
jgi:hypothetical protein